MTAQPDRSSADGFGCPPCTRSAVAKEVDERVSALAQASIPALTAAPLLVADNVETAELVTSGGMEFLDQWQAAADAGVRG